MGTRLSNQGRFGAPPSRVPPATDRIHPLICTSLTEYMGNGIGAGGQLSTVLNGARELPRTTSYPVLRMLQAGRAGQPVSLETTEPSGLNDDGSDSRRDSVLWGSISWALRSDAACASPEGKRGEPS